MIISVTGLRPRSLIAYIRFWWLAVPSFRQAQSAKGNLFCQTRSHKGYQHTLTAWKDRKSMKHYVLSGAHRKAMGQFHKLATGATITFESDSVPDWDEALAKWHKEAEFYQSDS